MKSPTQLEEDGELTGIFLVMIKIFAALWWITILVEIYNEAAGTASVEIRIVAIFSLLIADRLSRWPFPWPFDEME